MKKILFVVLIPVTYNSLNGMAMNDLPKALATLNSQLNTLAEVLKKLSSPPAFPPRPTPQPKPEPEKISVFPPDKGEGPKIPIKIQKKEPTVKKVEIPTISLTTFAALETGYLQPLEKMPEQNLAQTLEKKAQAKGLLNAILAYTRSSKYQEQQKQKIQESVKRIIKIDPLLISTAALILKQVNSPLKNTYGYMEELYKNQIKVIAEQLGEIKTRKGTQKLIPKGVRDDIDEAISLPIELQGEIQNAKNIISIFEGKKNQAVTQKEQEDYTAAKEFIEKIEALREQLYYLLKDNESMLRALKDLGIDIDIDFYLSLFEKKLNRVYCVTEINPNLYPDRVYKPFIEDLKEIFEDIKDYELAHEKYLPSMKVYKIQDILNKLNGFLAHATEKSYCQICLANDINAIYQANLQQTFDVNQHFNKIKNFLENLYKQNKNEVLKDMIDNKLPQLKNAFLQKGCPIKE
jgi:hypothetical protein